jgi:hypothetical protein
VRVAAAAVAIAVAVAVGLDVSEGSSAGPRLAIAYVRGTASSVPQVWIAGPDGEHARRLGPGTEPLLAPAGSLVAASTVARSGPALVVYSAGAPASARAFFDVRRAIASAAAWSSDSRYVAVTLSSTDPLSDASSGLAVIDTRTWSYRVIARGSIYGASFAPNASDHLAYALARGASLTAPVDVHVSAADGRGDRRITFDGRSLYPVWGAHAIAFAHERLRPMAAPVCQVWLMRPDGGHRVDLTHVRVPPLMDGLVPISFTGGGAWVLAEYEGQDTSRAWAISVARRQARELRVDGQPVAGSALSRSGGLALVDVGGFLNSPDAGAVVALPLAGSGRPRLLAAHGSDPSWSF